MSEKLSYEKLEQKIEALEQEIDICKQSERIMKVYKNAIEDSLDIIAAVDRNYKYLFANQTYLEYHQLNGEKIIGKYFGDDEDGITDLSKKMLERLGFHVEARLNPVEALDLFKSKSKAFDLVITDMTMPQMTGIKLAEKIMNIRPDIPVLICTGHSSLIDKDKATQLGIADYITKPVSFLNLAKTIRKILDD